MARLRRAKALSSADATRVTAFCRYHDADDPLAAIGYEPDWLLSQARTAGFELISSPRLGTWCGRQDGVGYQDVIALRCVTAGGSLK